MVMVKKPLSKKNSKNSQATNEEKEPSQDQNRSRSRNGSRIRPGVTSANLGNDKNPALENNSLPNIEGSRFAALGDIPENLPDNEYLEDVPLLEEQHEADMVEDILDDIEIAPNNAPSGLINGKDNIDVLLGSDNLPNGEDMSPHASNMQWKEADTSIRLCPAPYHSHTPLQPRNARVFSRENPRINPR